MMNRIAERRIASLTVLTKGLERLRIRNASSARSTAPGMARTLWASKSGNGRGRSQAPGAELEHSGEGKLGDGHLKTCHRRILRNRLLELVFSNSSSCHCSQTPSAISPSRSLGKISEL